ncbi:hypothetical protein D9M68_120870 [compost metagenome]
MPAIVLPTCTSWSADPIYGGGAVDAVAVASRTRDAGLAVLPLLIWYANGRMRHTPRGLAIGFANIMDAGEASRLAQTLYACLDG